MSYLVPPSCVVSFVRMQQIVHGDGLVLLRFVLFISSNVAPFVYVNFLTII